MKRDSLQDFMAHNMLLIYKETRDFKSAIESWGVDVWLCIDDDSVPNDFHNLPNFIDSRTIRNSPLYKLMEEVEE